MERHSFFLLVFPTLKAIIVAIWPSCWSFNSSDWVLYDIDVSPELTSNSSVQTQNKNNISQCNRLTNLLAVRRVKKQTLSKQHLCGNVNAIKTGFLWMCFRSDLVLYIFFHLLITLTCGFRYYWVINEWTSERFLIKHAWMCKQN